MNPITRFFDGLTAPLFRTDADGRTLYFPAGIYSKGRLIADPVRAAELRANVRRLYMGFFFLVIPVAAVIASQVKRPALGLLFAFAVLAGVALNIALFTLARGLPVTEGRMTLGDAYRQQAGALDRGWLMALVIGMALLLVGSVLLAVFGTGADRWMGIGGAALFSGLLAIFAFQLRSLPKSA